MFGAGLIELIEDSTILENQASSAAARQGLGIRGRPNIAVSGRTVTGSVNRNGNDGTITRFGWKAQNVSLLLFSGEAYNVEMGISSDLFQNERDQSPDCYFGSIPNDVQDMDANRALSGMMGIQTSRTSSGFSRRRRRPSTPPAAATRLQGAGRPWTASAVPRATRLR